MRNWINLINEQVVGIVPDIGTILHVGTDSSGTPRRFVVSGWLKNAEIDDADLDGNIQKTGTDNCHLIHCPRNEAAYVKVKGLVTKVIRVGEGRVVGRAPAAKMDELISASLGQMGKNLS